jgi:glutamate dehydrogenase/leucine dehydrogenase
MYQNIHKEKWSKKKVFSQLKTKMENATLNVLSLQKKYKSTMREAAYIIALEKIKSVHKDQSDLPAQ